MKLNIKGSPDDLIKRCDECDYCIFEDILPEYQRRIKILDLPIPQRHMNRMTIEQICGKNYYSVCLMKYVAMRYDCDDATATQMGAIKDFIWDIGKTKKRRSNYNEAMREWTRLQNLGNGEEESYAKRFRKVWNMGLRKNKQILTSPQIYEIVISNAIVYRQGIIFLNNLKKGHEERDAVGKE